MNRQLKKNGLKRAGAVLILSGIISVFSENGTALHTITQITFVLGCVLYFIGIRISKKLRGSTLGIVLFLSLLAPALLSAQDYSPQVEAFEESFKQKDIKSIQPYLSDSLKFSPLPVQHTIPILTNIVTKLPVLNSLEIQSSEHGKVWVKYDFEQLGHSESEILLNTQGKIIKIAFVENLIQQEMEQQRKMQASVQAPKPDKIAFDYSKKAVEFASKDGLQISAELYEVNPAKPVILLCHQAGYNKYEYADIAPRLNQLGFNVLAIDQRSGGTFAEKANQTHKRAMALEGEKIDYTDALQDIESAIKYLADLYKQKVILWGSSYSSSLALYIAQKNEKVKAVIAFSPGDYFGEKLPSLAAVFPQIEQPYWVTSSRQEADQLKALLNAEDNSEVQFIPDSEGFHGSKALWIDQEGAEEYWESIRIFLSKFNS